MASNNTLAYSLVFKVLGDAKEKILEIANIMGAPAEAADKMAEATEKSSDRQVSAMRRMKDAIDNVTATMTRPIARMAELGRVAGEASEHFARSFAGIGAIAAEGFSIKDVAAQEEYFRRLQINTGMAKSAIEELREAMARAADNYGVKKSSMVDAFGAFRANGGDVDVFKQNADTIAATLQLTGMDAQNAGAMFATLQSKMHLKGPDEFLSVISQMRQQLKGIPDGMDAAAEAMPRLAAAMESLHMSGANAVLALNAVYAVAARSSGGNARVARSATDNWISQLADRGYQNQLSQGLGERVTDANGFVMDPRIIMQKMAAKYAQAMSLPANQQAVSLQRLDAMFGADAARMFRSVGGEIKGTGHSATIDRVLSAQGDGAGFTDKAHQASDGLTGSMNRLRTAMDNASEALFTAPLNAFATALNHCTGIVADLVVGFASFIAIGQGIKWITGAAEGFGLLSAGIWTVVTSLWAYASAMVPVIGETIAWTAALLANPVTWIFIGIVAAIALVGGAIYYAYNHWTAFHNAIQTALKWFSTAIDTLFKNPFTAALASVLSPALALFNLPKLFGSSWGAWFDWIGQKIDWAIQKFKDGWAAGKAFFGFGEEAPKSGATTDTAGAAPASAAPDWGAGATGTDAMSQFMAHVRASESGGHDAIRARGSSATGRYQFTDGTWLHYFARTFGNQGLSRDAILARRTDGSTQDAVMKTAIADYTAKLGQMGAAATPGNLYLMHFAGEGGARRLLGASTGANAGAIMGAGAVRANPWLAGKSVGEVRAMLDRKATGGTATGIPGMGAASAIAAGNAVHANAIPPGTSGTASIYGAHTASLDPAPAPLSIGAGSAGTGGQARAELTIRVVDDKHRVKTQLQHSADMEAHLDRGPSMALRWG